MGIIFGLEILTWSVAMASEKREGIQLDIAGHDLAYPEVGQPPKEPVDSKKGSHFIHIGGKHDSFLTLPFIAR